MFTSKAWTDDSRLLQESNLAARQPQGAASVIQAITGEGLAQGPYVVARGGVESTTFRTEGTDNLRLTNHVPAWRCCIAFIHLSHSAHKSEALPITNQKYTHQKGDRTIWYWTKCHGQNGSNFNRFQFNWIEYIFSNHKLQISDNKPKLV